MAHQEEDQSRHMGFGFSGYSDSNQPQMGFDHSSSDIYSFATGIEMAGFQPKNLFMDKPRPGGFFEEEPSVRCVFPCEGNEKPSQGLSLSLSSTNPSTIGLQSFELRHTQHQQGGLDFVSSSSRDGYSGKSGFQQQDEQGQVWRQFQAMIRRSKYLVPVQELLDDFCSLGTKQASNDEDDPQNQTQKQANGKGDDSAKSNINCGSTSSNVSRLQLSLYALDLMELQKRKKKLLLMLEELDRRYNLYQNQMKAVVSSFETVAGEGVANAYTSLASKAMSRHFRCLRDGIMAQIKATKAAMGDKDGDGASFGATKGETPRLRALDQALRQQKAIQQMSLMESHPWRPQRGLPERSVSVLRAWLFEHFLHPYPSDVDKHILARQTGLSRSQVSNWFINARVRLWKPMVEEMYMEEQKEGHLDNMVASSSAVAPSHKDSGGDHRVLYQSTNPQYFSVQDQKPTQNELMGIESESLSSIISVNNNHTSSSHYQRQHDQGFGRVMEGFGEPTTMDFSSYTNNDQNALHEGFGPRIRANVGGGVSLTLGLQQHEGASGVGLASFPSTSPPSSLFYDKDGMESAVVQYSLLDGDQIQGQNLRYRNMQMGTQLLHDFA